MLIEKQDSSGPGWLIKPKTVYGHGMAEALRPVFIAKNLLIKPSMKPSQLGPYSHCIQMAVGENSQNYQQLEMDGFKSK